MGGSGGFKGGGDFGLGGGGAPVEDPLVLVLGTGERDKVRDLLLYRSLERLRSTDLLLFKDVLRLRDLLRFLEVLLSRDILLSLERLRSRDLLRPRTLRPLLGDLDRDLDNEWRRGLTNRRPPKIKDIICLKITFI